MIEQKVFDFLKQLGENNNREWFQENKSFYESTRTNIESFVASLIAGINKFDPEIGAINPRSCMFRIYRDVRFSKDKSPYKLNFGAWIAKSGKSGQFAGYYLHIQPSESFLAGGIYMPSPEILKKLRQEIAFNLKEFKLIIENPTFKKFFKGVDGEKLSRMPKEFSKGFGDEEFLKYKSYVLMHEVIDKQVISENYPDYCLKVFQAMKPFNDYLNRALEI